MRVFDHILKWSAVTLMTMLIVLAPSILNTVVNEKHQRKAAENGLAATVVEMSKEKNMIAKEIAIRLGIKTESVYDILETEEEK